MDKIGIKENDIVDFIFDTLYSSKINLEKVNNGRYHHNRSYDAAPSVCKYGILSLLELNKLGIRNDSLESLKKLGDIDSHINGIDGISLAVVGLTDLYRDEDEYNPFDSSVVDFIVSSNIKARRNAIHYGNEFICPNSIGLEDIKSLDVRIFEYIRLNEERCLSYDRLISMYNNLLQSAINLKSMKSNILLREMSVNNSFSIDIDKFSGSPSLVLKK